MKGDGTGGLIADRKEISDDSNGERIIYIIIFVTNSGFYLPLIYSSIMAVVLGFAISFAKNSLSSIEFDDISIWVYGRSYTKICRYDLKKNRKWLYKEREEKKMIWI